MNRRLNLLSVLIIIALSLPITAQNSPPPTMVIKYDLKNPVNPEVPFDKPFAILVEGVQSSEIEKIDVYETTYFYGNLKQVETTYKDGKGIKQNIEMRDFEAKKDPNSKELLIHFPPIKPNKTFIVHLQKKMSPECKELLMKYNSTIISGTDKTQDFDKVIECTRDKTTGYSFFGINQTDVDYINTYKSFFNEKLEKFYTLLATEESYTMDKKISLKNVRALDSASTHFVENYIDCKYLYEMVRRDGFKDILLGNNNIYNSYSLYLKDKADTYNFIKRQAYLQANLKFFDEAIQRCTRILSRGVDQITIGTDIINIESIRKELSEFRYSIYKNLQFFENNIKEINDALDSDQRFRQSISMGGNTLSMTIKAAGGNILFLDMGLTNVFAKNLNDEIAFLPKLYFGVSIYFRPIDKNTRSSILTRKKQLRPALNKVCRTEGVNEICGPDYGVVSTWSIWQHLSLNAGITLGGMQDKDFDNLYNNNSLLIGPAFRFARAFKIGAGLSLLRRSSKNPLISDKKIISGAYVSLSVDIDFVESIKNVTSILFK